MDATGGADEVLFESKRSWVGNYLWGGFLALTGLGVFLIPAAVALYSALVAPNPLLQQRPTIVLLVIVALGFALTIHAVEVMTDQIEVRRRSLLMRSGPRFRERIVDWRSVDRISLSWFSTIGSPASPQLHRKGTSRKIKVPVTYLQNFRVVSQAVLVAAAAANPSIEIDADVWERFGSPRYESVQRMLEEAEG